MDLKDIIREEALRFLPAKSLLRFRAVCQDWRLKISLPFFHHNQSLCCRDISGLFCQTCKNHPVFIPIDPTSSGVPDPSLSFLPEPVVIRASSNGLLCLQGRNEDRYYYMCNPVTKQWKKLPKPTACHGSKPALVLIFEPSLLNFVPEYKLICAIQSADFDDATGFEIYSSKDNSWNVSGEINFGVRKGTLGCGAHVNGVVYWPVKSGGILSFDLTKDRSQFLESFIAGLPCLLGSFDGKLCKVLIFGREMFVKVLVDIHRNTRPLDNPLGEMPLDEYDMWKTRVLDTDNTDMPLGKKTKVIAVSRDIVVVKRRNKFYSYDFEHRRTKALPRPPAESSYYKICVPYVNSLVSL